MENIHYRLKEFRSHLWCKIMSYLMKSSLIFIIEIFLIKNF